MMTERTLRGAASEETTDAIELLTADHAEVAELFEEYDELVADDASPADRVAIATQICQALTAHATAEEEIFYPAARSAIGDDDLIDDAVAEHASAKALIAQIESMDGSDDLYDATVRLLQEAIEHHVHEEEGDLFPRVRESDIDLDRLGERIIQRKEEVLAELDEEE